MSAAVHNCVIRPAWYTNAVTLTLTLTQISFMISLNKNQWIDLFNYLFHLTCLAQQNGVNMQNSIYWQTDRQTDGHCHCVKPPFLHWGLLKVRKLIFHKRVPTADNKTRPWSSCANCANSRSGTRPPCAELGDLVVCSTPPTRPPADICSKTHDFQRQKNGILCGSVLHFLWHSAVQPVTQYANRNWNLLYLIVDLLTL